MTMKQAARKAVVANVSDLAAKGVRPLAGLVALGLPRNLSKVDVESIAKGLAGAAREYGFPIVGGDTNESKDLTISIALIAFTSKRNLVLRSGAKVGDIVAVTGQFGSASAGLKALLKEHLPPATLAPAISRAVYRPRAELDLGLALANSRALSASIDSSDGLAWSLHELARASNVGIVVSHVPVSKAARDFAGLHHYDVNDLALYGGEEYHLVVTVRPRRFNSAKRAARGRLVEIGVVAKKSEGVRLKGVEAYSKIPMRGWEHFKLQA
jgi:thiamine-monophosphate kinase